MHMLIRLAIFSELSIKSGGVFIKGSNPVYVTEDDLVRTTVFREITIHHS